MYHCTGKNEEHQDEESEIFSDLLQFHLSTHLLLTLHTIVDFTFTNLHVTYCFLFLLGKINLQRNSIRLCKKIEIIKNMSTSDFQRLSTIIIFEDETFLCNNKTTLFISAQFISKKLFSTTIKNGSFFAL